MNMTAVCWVPGLLLTEFSLVKILSLPPSLPSTNPGWVPVVGFPGGPWVFPGVPGGPTWALLVLVLVVLEGSWTLTSTISSHHLQRMTWGSRWSSQAHRVVVLVLIWTLHCSLCWMSFQLMLVLPNNENPNRFSTESPVSATSWLTCWLSRWLRWRRPFLSTCLQSWPQFGLPATLCLILSSLAGGYESSNVLLSIHF